MFVEMELDIVIAVGMLCLELEVGRNPEKDIKCKKINKVNAGNGKFHNDRFAHAQLTVYNSSDLLGERSEVCLSR